MHLGEGQMGDRQGTNTRVQDSLPTGDFVFIFGSSCLRDWFVRFSWEVIYLRPGSMRSHPAIRARSETDDDMSHPSLNLVIPPPQTE